MPGRKL